MCIWCGSAYDCDCIERRDCKLAGFPLHTQCGACPEWPTRPRFACEHCHQAEVAALNAARKARVGLPVHLL